MGAIATFSLPAFTGRYPEFGGIDPTLASLYFAEATLYHANDGTGPVQDPGQQLALLNMLTAHIASLYALNGDGTAASTLVGRITSAGEGSVSVSTDMPSLPASAAFLSQTKYGLAYWDATSGYRSFQYVAGPRAFSGPGRGYGGYGRW